MTESTPGRILIVDDDASSRILLKTQLLPFGYEIFEAVDGLDALEKCGSENPDLIIMDINMPNMDGYDATRVIKETHEEQYIPVLFITSSTDEMAIARGTDAGGDDFLTKPITPVVLDARIRSALRNRELYQQLQEQHWTLQKHQVHEARDQELAKEIFGRIAHLGCLDEAKVDYIASSLMVFNGDMLLAARTPYGALRVMLGDFTGHGLPAAIGSLPTAETFYGMTDKGFHLSEVAEEINAKLNRILPKGIFCAAALIELNSETSQLQIWNGGLPHLILYQDEPREIRHLFDSVHLALGILSPGDFDSKVETIPVSANSYLVAYSDGIVETENLQGELYGDHRLLECIQTTRNTGGMYQVIMDRLEDFREHAEQADDYTLIEIPCNLRNHVETTKEHCIQPPKPATRWNHELSFTGNSLAEVDPVPMLLHTITHLQGLDCYREDLFTILTELWVNALDHGILKLDSALKHSTEGFAEYFVQRTMRLENIQDGSITLMLKHQPCTGGGQLTIRVQDTGPGFDEDAVLKQLEEQPLASGRGMLLVRSLCTSLTYSDKGRVAEAVYQWKG